MGRPVEIAVSLNGLVPTTLERHEELPAFAADLEALGVDLVVLGEHLLQADVEHPGGVAVDLTFPFPDPFTVLAAVAATTNRIGLTTGAVIAPTRSALILAKLAATVDVLSGGRFSLGVTSGWYEPEFVAVDVPFAERFARLDETLAACRALWGTQPATFSGRWTSFTDVHCQPVPVHGAALPVWFGGLVSDRSARRVALCDGWIVSEATAAGEIPAGIERIAKAAVDIGKPAGSLGVRATVSRRLLGSRGVLVEIEHAAERIATDVVRLNGLGATQVVVPVAEFAVDRDRALELVRLVLAGVDAQLAVIDQGAMSA